MLLVGVSYAHSLFIHGCGPTTYPWGPAGATPQSACRACPLPGASPETYNVATWMWWAATANTKPAGFCALRCFLKPSMISTRREHLVSFTSSSCNTHTHKCATCATCATCDCPPFWSLSSCLAEVGLALGRQQEGHVGAVTLQQRLRAPGVPHQALHRPRGTRSRSRGSRARGARSGTRLHHGNVELKPLQRLTSL